jgi:hypothetical protein
MRRRRDSEEGEEASGEAADLAVVADSGAAGSAVEDSEAGCRAAALEVGLPEAASGAPVSVVVARWLWPV